MLPLAFGLQLRGLIPEPAAFPGIAQASRCETGIGARHVSGVNFAVAGRAELCGPSAGEQGGGEEKDSEDDEGGFHAAVLARANR